jgi:hypothetical protein
MTSGDSSVANGIELINGTHLQGNVNSTAVANGITYRISESGNFV